MASADSLAATVEILDRLVGFDTTSARSNLELIDWITDYLGRYGIASTRSSAFDGKANLFATIGPADAGGVILSGHTDVVPVDGQDWSTDPFDAVVKDGKLFGRGACDMKGFIAVALSLLPQIAAATLARPLHLALSYDEEVGCVGVTGLLEDLRKGNIKPALAIIGEPTLMRIVGAHKGGAKLVTHCCGKEGHSSAPHKGASAVMMAGEFIAALGRVGAELEHDRDDRFDPPYTTTGANVISGGTALNILAGECTITWECRPLPGRDPLAVVARMKEIAQHTILPKFRRGAPDADFETVVAASYPGLALDPDSPAVRLARELTGANAVETAAYGTEAGHFARAGIPAVICGPGSIEQAHKADEYCALSEIDACKRFLSNVVARACA